MTSCSASSDNKADDYNRPKEIILSEAFRLENTESKYEDIISLPDRQHAIECAINLPLYK